MNMKRMRGRNHRPNSGGGGGSTGGGFRNQQNGIPLNRNHVFDSSGPEMRVRGTAQQLYDKYQQLARDASSNGDRVTGEAYYQHAEHYFRIISAINQAQGQPNPPQNNQNNQNQNNQPYQSHQGGNNGQDRGNNYQSHNGQGDYNRRQDQNGGNEVSTEPQTEGRGYQEARPQQESRPPQEPRRYEQRPYEPRNKPDFQPRPERQDRQDRYRPEPPAVDPRIDISSALEAELTATVAEPDIVPPPGFGDQPVIAPAPMEARAIPIIPDAPPAAEAVRVPRPRGRPKIIKTEAE